MKNQNRVRRKSTTAAVASQSPKVVTAPALTDEQQRVLEDGRIFQRKMGLLELILPGVAAEGEWDEMEILEFLCLCVRDNLHTFIGLIPPSLPDFDRAAIMEGLLIALEVDARLNGGANGDAVNGRFPLGGISRLRAMKLESLLNGIGDSLYRLRDGIRGLCKGEDKVLDVTLADLLVTVETLMWREGRIDGPPGKWSEPSDYQKLAWAARAKWLAIVLPCLVPCSNMVNGGAR